MTQPDEFPEESSPKASLMLSNTFYNLLKPIASTILPGLAALYISLAQVWGWSYEIQVGLTITAVNTFLGLVLLVSSHTYNNSDAKYSGSIEVVETDGEKKVQLNLPENPDDLLGKDDVILKVV